MLNALATPSCGSRRALLPAVELFQIRKGYRARWHNLSFTVEASAQQWTLQVWDAEQSLYTAHRATVEAAQAAAAEFGICREFGACNAETAVKLARTLVWAEYW